MWEIDKIKEYLKLNLKPSRYGHTLGVVNTAIKLAEIHGEDIKKAEIAALCHDVAKNMELSKIRNILKEENIVLSVDEENTTELCHLIALNISLSSIFFLNS